MLRKTLKGADFARVMACSAVFVHHLADFARKPDLPGILAVPLEGAVRGRFGVSIFFVLSGFLLALPFWKQSDAARPFDLRYYAAMRIARVVPATWLCLIVSVLVDILYFDQYGAFTIVRLLAGFAFVGDWHWLTLFPVGSNGPLWSLSFEISSYMFMPVAFLLCRAIAPALLRGWSGRYLWSAVILVALLLHAAAFALLPKADVATAARFGVIEAAVAWFPTYNPFGFFAMFAIGTLAAGVHTALPENARWLAVARAILVLCAGVLLPFILFAKIFAHGEVPKPPFAFPVLPLAIAIFLVCAQHVRLGRLLDNKFVAKFAQLSFGVYIWHQLVLIFVTRLVDMEPFPSAWRLALIGIISAVTTAVIAGVSYKYFEEPILERARLWAKRDTHGKVEGASTPFRASTTTVPKDDRSR